MIKKKSRREEIEKRRNPFLLGKNDIIFKEIFLNNKNKDLLLELLNTCLPHKIKTILDIRTELNEGTKFVRRKVLDVLLETNIGIINIEVNRTYEDYLHTRNAGYIFNVYSRKVLRGKKYDKLEKVIQINLSYGINKEDKEALRTYELKETAKEGKEKKFIDNLEIYEYNMDIITEFWYSKDKAKIKKYTMLIILGLPIEELEKLASLGDRRVVKYKMELERVNNLDDLFYWMSPEQDEEMHLNSMKSIYQRKGLEEGIEQGIEKGIEKEKKEIIMNSYKEGVSVDFIAKITKTSKEEIISILKENNLIKQKDL